MRDRFAVDPDELAVRFDGVQLAYAPGRQVLRDVTLELTPGSFTFLTGPSGAGKSSLLKLAYLALRPSEGRVSLFGVDTTRVKRPGLTKLRRRIGVVFQEFRLLEHLTAYENASLPLRVCGEKEERYRDDVIDLLRWVGLGERIDALPATLSGGEQQRVAIARAVVNKPDLIIADEPTGNVDGEMGARLIRLFSELNRRLNTTILVATHDLDIVRRSKADVLRLSGGVLSRTTAEALGPSPHAANVVRPGDRAPMPSPPPMRGAKA